MECLLSKSVARVKSRWNGVDYNFGDIFEISSRSTLYVGSLSSAGDSGSWVLYKVDDFGPTFDLYGLLMAGNGKTSLCAFADHVMGDLGRIGNKVLSI